LWLTRAAVSFTDWYGVLCAQAEKFDAEDLVAPKGSPFDHLPPVNKVTNATHTHTQCCD